MLCSSILDLLAAYLVALSVEAMDKHVYGGDSTGMPLQSAVHC